MDVLSKAVSKIDSFCEKHSIPYSIIGGIAAISKKLNRTTDDIDVNLLIELEDLSRIYDEISKEFSPRFGNAKELFEKSFVLPVCEPETKMRIDFIAGLSQFDKEVIKRSKRIMIGEAAASVCTVEDLIIYKLFAARHQDLSDVEMLIRLNVKELDKKYLFDTAEKFLKLDRKDLLENLKKYFSED